MSTSYEQDVVAWSIEQAELLRSGRFTELDIAHIADEIEDVGKSEQRELERRMMCVSVSVIKINSGRFRGEKRDRLIRAIELQLNGVIRMSDRTPSLKTLMMDEDWLQAIWNDALVAALQDGTISSDDIPEKHVWVIGPYDDELGGTNEILYQ